MASSKSAAKLKSEKRFSGRFTFRSEKKKEQAKDKVELEDSGVHLEEPTSSIQSSVSEFQDDLDGCYDLDPKQSNQLQPSSQMTHRKGKLSPKSFIRHCAVSAPDLGPNQRISKSESPQPPSSRYPPPGDSTVKPTEQFPPLAGTGIPNNHPVRNTQRYSTHSPGVSTAQDKFYLDSDESDHEPEVKKTIATKAKDSRAGREKSSNKGRFKKILKPLRRSHSAGSAKDVPAHALFLRHDLTDFKTPPGRRSVDTGRGSMERQSDDSDSDRDQPSSESKSSSASSSKSKKKSLAQDMKEKFSFLRRRPTDSSLSSTSSKDGKPVKPTKEMVLSWSHSFDNLLRDKVGLEWFKDFLGTEFSEENVEFWIACEEYKSIKSNKLNARAQEIFTDFVAVQAPREINLDSKTRMTTKELVEKPDRETFEIAQKRIQALMDKDSYPRFLRSDGYQKLLSDYKLQITLT